MPRIGDIVNHNSSHTINTATPLNIAINLPALAASAKFVLLHFSVTNNAGVGGPLTGNDKIMIAASGNSPAQTFTATSGREFWTTPIVPNAVISIQGTGGSRFTVDRVAYPRQTTLNGVTVHVDVFNPNTTEINVAADAGIDRQDITVLSAANATHEKLKTASKAVGLLVFVANTGSLAPLLYDDEDDTPVGLYAASAVLYESDKIMTAAHNVNTVGHIELASGTFILNYDKTGTPPRFFKLAPPRTGNDPNPINWGVRHADFSTLGSTNVQGKFVSGVDYAICELLDPVPANDARPLPLTNAALDPSNGRPTLPYAINEKFYLVHFPMARPMKISGLTAANCKYMAGYSTELDVANDNISEATQRPILIGYDCLAQSGSSGAPLLRLESNVVKLAALQSGLSAAALFLNKGYDTVRIQDYFVMTLDAPRPTNIVAVVDMSYSMNLPAKSGETKTKMTAAREALDMFFSIVKTRTGANDNGIGLVTFDHTATEPANVDLSLRLFDTTTKTTLNGLLPQIIERGATSIGAGIRKAQGWLNLLPANIANNRPAILLLTDGFENTIPYISEVESSDLVGKNTQIHVIGFGAATNLDSTKLMNLANRHSGLYTHAEDALGLKKYYALAFGNIFALNNNMVDPFYTIEAGSDKLATPIEVPVLGEEALTVILGWENESAHLIFRLIAPQNQNVITFNSADTAGNNSYNWAHLRVPLPYAGANYGTWTIEVERLNREPLGFFGHRNPVIGVAYSPDNKTALSISPDELIEWDIKTGSKIYQYPVAVPPFSDGESPREGEGEGENQQIILTNVVYAPDGSTAYVAQSDGKILAINLKSKSVETILDIVTISDVVLRRASLNPVSLAIRPDGAYLAIGLTELATIETEEGPETIRQGRLYMLDIANNTLFGNTSLPNSQLTGLAYSADGLQILAGTTSLWAGETVAILFDAKSANLPDEGGLFILPQLATFTAPNSGSNNMWQKIVFHPDGKRAVILDGIVRVWKLDAGDSPSEGNDPRLVREINYRELNLNALPTSVAVSSDGQYILVGSVDYRYPEEISVDDVELSSVRVSAASASFNAFATSDGPGSIHLSLWQIETGELVHNFNNFAYGIYSVAFSPDGRRALSGGFATETNRYRGIVTLWDVESGKPVFGPLDTSERFFVNVVGEGGPRFFPVDLPSYFFTGDTITPSVALRLSQGNRIPAKSVSLTVEVPTTGEGNILHGVLLRDELNVGGDTIDRRHATLMAIENEQNEPLIPRETHNYSLYDDGVHNDGAMEPDGIWANVIEELIKNEGVYSFFAKADYGNSEYRASREAYWSIHARIGIDQSKTERNATEIDRLPNGRRRVRVKFRPRDRYGNYLGPGKLGEFKLNPIPGNENEDATTDNDDGSYTQVVIWDPAANQPVGIEIAQPGRNPVRVTTNDIDGPTGEVPEIVSKSLIAILLGIILGIIIGKDGKIGLWGWLLIIILILVILVILFLLLSGNI